MYAGDEWLVPGNRGRGGSTYLLPQILDDTGSGHNVVSTAFVECLSMNRADGPADTKPIGETELVQGVVAMSASGGFGATRVAGGIVRHADLMLGDGVAPTRAHTGRPAPPAPRSISA